MNVKEKVTGRGWFLCQQLGSSRRFMFSSLLCWLPDYDYSKGGEKVGFQNGEIILPAICYYFVLVVSITESVIKLHAYGLGRNRIFFSQ